MSDTINHEPDVLAALKGSGVPVVTNDDLASQLTQQRIREDMEGPDFLEQILGEGEGSHSLPTQRPAAQAQAPAAATPAAQPAQGAAPQMTQQQQQLWDLLQAERQQNQQLAQQANHYRSLSGAFEDLIDRNPELAEQMLRIVEGTQAPEASATPDAQARANDGRLYQGYRKLAKENQELRQESQQTRLMVESMQLKQMYSPGFYDERTVDAHRQQYGFRSLSDAFHNLVGSQFAGTWQGMYQKQLQDWQQQQYAGAAGRMPSQPQQPQPQAPTVHHAGGGAAPPAHDMVVLAPGSPQQANSRIAEVMAIRPRNQQELLQKVRAVRDLQAG